MTFKECKIRALPWSYRKLKPEMFSIDLDSKDFVIITVRRSIRPCHMVDTLVANGYDIDV